MIPHGRAVEKTSFRRVQPLSYEKNAMTFEGHLGENITRLSKAGDYYRIVFKFDSMRNYLAWEGPRFVSDDYSDMLK